MFGLTSRSPTADSSQPSQGSSSSAHSGRSRNVIFGVDLEKSVAMANTPIRVKDPRGEMTTLGYLPVVVAKCGKAIKDYPEAASLLLHPIKVDQKLLSALEKKFESDPKYGRDIKWERIKGSMASALAAALFIKFLDDLPDPLFPHSLYPKLEAAHRIEGTYEERKQRYVKVFYMLDIVSRHRDVEIAVLARAFAPTVFRPPEGTSQEDLGTMGTILEYLVKTNNKDLDATIQELSQAVANRPIEDGAMDLSLYSPSASSSVQDLRSAESDDSLLTMQGSRIPAAVVPPSSDEVPDITSRVRKSDSMARFRGGFCEIFVGFCDNDGEPQKVALRLPLLKYKHEQVQRRFWREVELWFKQQHRHINPLLGTFSDDLGFYMVSPWRENGSIRACISAYRPFSHHRVLFGIANGLEYLHSNDYVHGDLKMDNVLLSEDGEALLTDFGLSKRLDPEIVTSTDIRLAGSFPWLAPELLMGGKKSKESDVYAFGMIISESLTRTTPFSTSKNVGEMIIKIMGGERPLKTDVVKLHSPDGWERLWEEATLCWAQLADARPEIRETVLRLQAML